MFERLAQIETKYEELNRALASPEIVSDSQRYQKTAKAHSEIAPIVEKYREYNWARNGSSRSIGRSEGEHPLQIPGHGHEAPFAAHVFEPAQRELRNPSADLMTPNTGSGVCLRRA